MATDKSIKESSDWEDSIYQIQAGDMLAGGENGLANLQAQQIANRTAWLKAHAGDESRIKNLENMMMELYEEEFGSDPTGEYSGLMVEMFNGNNSEIDSAWAVIISIADDGSYVDVYGGQSFTVGDICQIEDADGVEEVRIKSIDRMLDYDRVFFEKPVEKHGDEARLRRTTSFLPDGKQHVGNIEFGMVINAEHKTGKTVHPADIPHSLEGYEYENFHMEGEKLVMCAPSVFGVSLLQTGGGNGTWAHVDEEGYVIGKVVANRKDKNASEQIEYARQIKILPHYKENGSAGGNFIGFVSYTYDSSGNAQSKNDIDVKKGDGTPDSFFDGLPEMTKAQDDTTNNYNKKHRDTFDKHNCTDTVKDTLHHQKLDASVLYAWMENQKNLILEKLYATGENTADAKVDLVHAVFVEAATADTKPKYAIFKENASGLLLTKSVDEKYHGTDYIPSGCDINGNITSWEFHTWDIEYRSIGIEENGGTQIYLSNKSVDDIPDFTAVNI